ncbi:MAG TPA: Fic family protein [Methylomirabilota bacterium]|nr:Fic family protein [Methylomirabilota bacterium]
MSTGCPAWVTEDADQIRLIVSGLLEVQVRIAKQADKRILSHGDIREWHRTVFARVVPKSYYAGNYRGDDPLRPCLREDVAIAGLPGAPFDRVLDEMRAFSHDMHDRIVQTDGYVAEMPTPADRARSVVMLAAYLAGKFIRIHPFLNGNGRMSRMIVNYVCRRYGYRPLYPVPHNRPGADYEPASAACMRGDFSPMYRYLLEVLASR